jgi:kynurenine formamidase
MKITSLATVCLLLVTLLLFAQHRPQTASQTMFSAVVDASTVISKNSISTTLQAPSHFARGGWKVDQIPTQRLIAPLVVLDIRDKCRNAACEAGMNDVAKWEEANGRIPVGAVILSDSGHSEKSATLSLDATRFLIEGRTAFGIGTDTSALGIDTEKFSALQNVFVLKNVTQLDQLPHAGGIVVVAPTKIASDVAPARLLVLVK